MQAEELAKADETAPVPMHLRNAPTKMMKEMNYGSGYLYNPAYRYVLVGLFPCLI
jgi:putative ATPase